MEVAATFFFVKKEDLIKKVELLYDIETIYFQLSINGQLANFLNSYRSPTNDSIEKKIEFLDKLETLYYLHNPYFSYLVILIWIYGVKKVIFYVIFL
jgi:hypothetical protein